MARLGVQKRFEVFKRDKFTCQYCGAKGGRLEVDHVTPLCQGGTDEIENLKTACFNCNRGKSGTALDQKASPRIHRPLIKYAIHQKQDGTVDWCGEVVERGAEFVSINAVDASCLSAGLWSPSDEIFICHVNECRFFTDAKSAAIATQRSNEHLISNKR